MILPNDYILTAKIPIVIVPKVNTSVLLSFLG